MDETGIKLDIGDLFRRPSSGEDIARAMNPRLELGYQKFELGLPDLS